MHRNISRILDGPMKIMARQGSLLDGVQMERLTALLPSRAVL